ncbi:MAG: hypothetical protein ABW278_08930 [Steroidobacteraceae bacterium]
MIDTLIALLLFAIVILTACLTLTRSLRATHQALLSSRAVDAAADFIEDLHARAAGDDIDSLAAAASEQAAARLPAPARTTAAELIQLAATLHRGPAP